MTALALPAHSVTTLDVVHCLDWRVLLAALPRQSVDCVVTDMPYAVTQCAWDKPVDLALWWELVARVAKPRAAVVCTASQPFTSRLVMSNLKWFRYEWIWDKVQGSNPALVQYQPFKMHENVLIFGEGSITYNPQTVRGAAYQRTSGQKAREVLGGAFSQKVMTVNDGWRYPGSIIRRSNADQSDKLHPTQKPVALFEYLIRTYTQPGDVVCDPFVGSGTTALAARNTGRRFICGDLSAEYVRIARERLAAPYTLPLFAEEGERTSDPTERDAVQRALWAGVT